MTELLPKPKRNINKCHCASEEEGDLCDYCHEFDYLEVAYYKRLAEFADEILKRIESCIQNGDIQSAKNYLHEYLSTIKGSRDE